MNDMVGRYDVMVTKEESACHSLNKMLQDSTNAECILVENFLKVGIRVRRTGLERMVS